MQSVSLGEVVNCLDTLLSPANFSDYCPNGLQVEGRGRVARLVTGVTASQALIEAAAAARADAILVHHGFFWRGEDPAIVGIRRRRIASLLAHELSLLAYHLPLDEHPECGNNARLAAVLGLAVRGALAEGGGAGVAGLHGVLERPVTGREFAAHIARRLDRQPLHIAADRQIRTVAWCTGAGQGFITAAAALGVDAYLTGEVSEQTVHVARESNMHFFAAGHHATERYGVQAAGEYAARKLGIVHRYIDIDNPA